MAISIPTPSGVTLSSNGKVKVLANVQSESGSGTIGEKSLKSQRTYQVGVVYKDIYGRETPVFTNGTGSFTVPKDLCDKRNSIITSLQNTAPSWVDTFKFFVKETSNEYYNACMDRWYDAEDDNLWLSFPSAERNKIKEDGFIILKKKAAAQEAVYEEARYKVIDIKNEAPEDIKTDYDSYGQDVIRVVANGALSGSKTIRFDDDSSNDWLDSVFYDALLIGTNVGTTETGFIGWPLEDVVVKLSNTSGATTGWLDVGNIYEGAGDNIFVDLSKPLTDTIQGVIDDGTAVFDATVSFARKVVKNKAEFDGKFFVKIARDAVLDKNVREVGNITASFTVKQSRSQYYLNISNTTFLAPPPVTGQAETFWDTLGDKWFIDYADRSTVGSGSGVNYKGPFARDNGFGIQGDNASTGRSGNAESDLQCTMELSLNKIKDNDKDGYDISNNDQLDQDFMNTMKQSGTLFRWKEDPWQHVYRVITTKSSEDHNTDVGTPSHSFKKGILNYSSKKSKRKLKNNKSIRLYVKFVTTGWRLNEPQGVVGGVFQKFDEEIAKYPFNFNNTAVSGYTPAPGVLGTLSDTSADVWNPTKRGFGEYQTASGASAYDGDTTTAGTGTAWRSIEVTDQTSVAALDDATNTFNSNTIQIVDIAVGDEEPTFTKEPAIWETEPREDVGLDIYYEASQAYPTRLTDQTNELFAPYGCTVTCVDARNDKSFYLPDNTTLYDWAPTGHGGNAMLLSVKVNEVGIIDNNVAPSTSNPLLTTTGSSVLADLNASLQGLELQFTRPDGGYTTAKITSYSAWFPGQQVVPQTSPITYVIPPNYHVSGTHPVYPGTGTEFVLITLDRDLTNSKIKLPYFNCYSFGNGVESDRIRDDFNAVTIGKGVKASTVLPGLYKEEQRTNGLIYSGIYNSNSNLNNLNQFIAAEKITKDVPPTYGGIQKLKARDTNLVVFCEDKILKIVAYKDALYSADGKPQLIASNNVLGTISSFSGEFGISTNPESYAEDSFRMYCTDKQRGKVLRISGDGVTAISDYGMEDYFGDNLKQNKALLGSFDDNKQEYNLTLSTQQETLSFSESAKGWTSFKSFTPEDGLSINNNYYTFKGGELWQHHTNETRNNFYGDQYDSSVNVVFNEQSESVKSFASMKYEGTQSKITQNVTDGEYYNNIGKDGWYVESGITDLQEAGEMEFKSKEGKYFSYMKGKPVANVKDLNSKEFSFQGIALLDSITTTHAATGTSTTGASTTTGTVTTTTTTTISTGTVTSTGTSTSTSTSTGSGTGTSGGSSSGPPPAPTSFTITVSDFGDTD